MAKEKLAIDGGEPVVKGPFGTGKRFGEEELAELKDVIESGQLFRFDGAKVKAFEEEFARLMGAKHGVASTSGTSAIHLAVGALNPDPGDEIIAAPITDIGTIIPILYQGAIPVFADVDLENGNVTADEIERNITSRTKAVIVVHLAGNPCDMDPIMEIAKKHNIVVIEDCCQAHLSEYKGRNVGIIGDIGCFSFQMSKHISSGDGGITLTDNDEYAAKAKLFADKGWHREEYGPRRYTLLGLNYRMTELQGAVLMAQAKKLAEFIRLKRRNGDLLSELIKNTPGVRPQKLLPGCKHTYWHYELLVQPDAGFTAERFAHALNAEGVGCGAHYIGKPIFLCHDALVQKKIFGNSDYPFSYGDNPKKMDYREGLCPNCEDYLNRLIIFAISQFYTEEDVKLIAKAIQKVAEALKG